MRILIVTHLYPISPEDYKGVFVHRIAAALTARGHAVHVLAPMRPGGVLRERRDGVEIVRYRHWGWRRGRQLSQLKGTPPLMLSTLVAGGVLAAADLALRENIDCLYAYWVVPGGLIAWLAARLTGRPAVVTAAGSDLNAAARNPLYLPFVRRTLRGADRLIACGSELERIAIELGADPGRVAMLPSIVEVASPAGAESEPLAGVPGGRLLYVGNFGPPKRIDTLLRAMALVSRARPGVCLSLAGEGEEQASLEALVAELQLENNVRFLGRRPHNRIMSLMSGADLFLHCSDHEGLPVSIHEAIAAGLPVIAARVGGIPDLVRDGENGRLLGPDDERGFVRAILELTGDAEARAKMAAASLEFARHNLSANAVIVKIEETIKAAIASA